MTNDERWEYRRVVCDSAWGAGQPRDEELNRLGKEGWELVAVEKGTHDKWSPGEGLVCGIPCTVLQLKRKVAAPTPERRKVKDCEWCSGTGRFCLVKSLFKL